MPYIEATEARLYFEECGYGYPIIFVHEFASDMRGWESQLRHFSRSHRCITFNARGYPPSDIPQNAASYGWELAIDDIAASLEKKQEQRGQSWRGVQVTEKNAPYAAEALAKSRIAASEKERKGKE